MSAVSDRTGFAHRGVPALMGESTRIAVARGGVRFVLALAVYAGAALLASWAGERSMPLPVVIAATVVVAVVLWVSASAIDTVTTAWVLGPEAGAYRQMQRLLQRMATSLPVDDVVPRLAEAAGRATTSRAEVRLWLDGGEQFAHSWPARLVPGEPTPVAMSVDVRHAGTAVGRIQLGADGDEPARFDRRVLDALAGPAGLALSTVRLTLALRRRRDELSAVNAALEASSARLREARREEQERMRGDVAEAVTTHVDRAAEVLANGRLEAAAVEITQGLDALRRLARGIYPPRLAEMGLADALTGWVLAREGTQTVALPDVEVVSRGDRAPLQGRPDVEACLYFCAVTLINGVTVDTARSSRGSVRLEVVSGPGYAELRISGAFGGPPPDVVQRVRDRVGAFDGSVRVAIPDGIDRADPAPSVIEIMTPLTDELQGDEMQDDERSPEPGQEPVP